MPEAPARMIAMACAFVLCGAVMFFDVNLAANYVLSSAYDANLDAGIFQISLFTVGGASLLYGALFLYYLSRGRVTGSRFCIRICALSTSAPALWYSSRMDGPSARSLCMGVMATLVFSAIVEGLTGGLAASALGQRLTSADRRLERWAFSGTFTFAAACYFAFVGAFAAETNHALVVVGFGLCGVLIGRVAAWFLFLYSDDAQRGGIGTMVLALGVAGGIGGFWVSSALSQSFGHSGVGIIQAMDVALAAMLGVAGFSLAPLSGALIGLPTFALRPDAQRGAVIRGADPATEGDTNSEGGSGRRGRVV